MSERSRHRAECSLSVRRAIAWLRAKVARIRRTLLTTGDRVKIGRPDRGSTLRPTNADGGACATTAGTPLQALRSGCFRLLHVKCQVEVSSTRRVNVPVWRHVKVSAAPDESRKPA